MNTRRTFLATLLAALGLPKIKAVQASGRTLASYQERQRTKAKQFADMTISNVTVSAGSGYTEGDTKVVQCEFPGQPWRIEVRNLSQSHTIENKPECSCLIQTSIQ